MLYEGSLVVVVVVLKRIWRCESSVNKKLCRQQWHEESCKL